MSVDRPSHLRHILIVVACAATTALVHGMEGGTSGIFFPEVANALGVPVFEVAGYLTVKGIVMVGLTPVANHLLGRWPINWVLLLASVVYASGLQVLATAQRLEHIYAGAVLLGVGAAFISTVVVPLVIANWFTTRRGLALGVSFGVSGISGALFSPIVAGWIQAYGWRNAYTFLAIIVGGGLGTLMLALMRRRPQDVGTFPYGHDRTRDAATKATESPGQGRAFSRRGALTLLIIFGSMLALTNGMLFNLNNYALSIGFSSAIGAAATSAALLGATVGKFSLGALTDRWGPQRVLLTASVLGSVGLVIVLSSGRSAELLVAGAFVYGALISLMTLQPPIVTLSVLGEQQYRSQFKYVSMATQLSYAAAPMAFAAIASGAGGYLAVVLLSIACAFLAWFLSVRIISRAHTSTA